MDDAARLTPDQPRPDTDARLEGVAHEHGGALGRAITWWLANRRSYEAGKGDERPLSGYALLASGYTGGVLLAVALLGARRLRAELPTAGDLALLSTATAMLSRTLAKDAVTSPLRSPFTTFDGPGGPSEVMESPRDGAVRHAAGELITCPFCLAQWVATALVVSWAAAPRATRWVATTMTLVAASNTLQLAYAALQDAAE